MKTMKNIINIIGIGAIALLLFGCEEQQIIPIPQEIIMGNATIIISNGTDRPGVENAFYYDVQYITNSPAILNIADEAEPYTFNVAQN